MAEKSRPVEDESDVLTIRGTPTEIVAITEIVVVRRIDLSKVWWRNRSLDKQFRRSIGGPNVSISKFSIPDRRFLSISVWSNIDSLQKIGLVEGHIKAVHTALELKRNGRAIYTSCIYAYSGNWRSLLWPDMGSRNNFDDPSLRITKSEDPSLRS
jgi:hypothetical protein